MVKNINCTHAFELFKEYWKYFENWQEICQKNANLIIVLCWQNTVDMMVEQRL